MVSSVRNAARPSGKAAQANPAKAGRLPLPIKIYLCMVMVPFGFFAGPIYLTGVRLVLVLATPILTVLLLSGRFGKIRLADICFLMFLGWAALAYGIHHPEDLLEHIGSQGVEFIGGYLLARCFIRTREQFVTLCKTLAILAALLLPLGLLESQTGDPIALRLIQSIPGMRAPAIVTIEGRLGLERSQVIFAHPIHFGLFCTVAFSLTFVALKGIISNTRRYITAAVVGLCTFLALSSGALLALFLQMFMIFWFVVFRTHSKKWLYLLFLFMLAYVAIDILSTRPPIRVFMSYATFSAHTAYWRGIIFEWGVMNIFGSVENNIPASPWIGIGHNDWVRPFFIRSPSVDNFWLLTTMNYGVPALVMLLVGYVITIFRVGFRDLKGDTQLENMRRAWVFTFAGLTFTLITVHIWTTIYSFVFFMFGAGIWFLSAEPRREDAEPETQDTPAEPHSGYTRFPAKTRPDIQLARGNSA